MKKMAIAKLLASTVVLGTTMVGCGMNGQAARPSSASAAQAETKAAYAAKQSAKALAKRKFDKAIGLAETAVGLMPRDAGYRMLLGQAYLAAGRFASAEQSFTDTLTLNPELERAALNLALAQAALGKRDAARSTLADYRDKLPAADYGLAVALAGDAEEAVRILEFATRAPDSNAKTRQNLALAYAFAGKWTNAKVMAIQDLTPDEADARVAQWATLVRPNSAYDQVAAVLGVTPRADGGQPARLALVSPVAAPVQQAAVEPVPAPVVEPAPAPVEVAAVVEPQPVFETPVEPVPVAVKAAPKPVKVAPLIKAAPTPVRTAVVPPSKVAPAPARIVKAAVTSTAPRAMLRPAVAMRPISSGGKYVVQLGAFSNAKAAEGAWNRMSGRFQLASYDAIGGNAKARGSTLVRVAIGGFGTRDDANRLCARIKQGGGVCFVRLQDGDAPARWVQRQTYRVASR